MVAQVYDSIQTIKPYVKFGISPFGIVENKYAGTNGFESYNQFGTLGVWWFCVGNKDRH